ncbi:HAD family hydrolase [Natronoglomus mannanivorans]|uniref:HAD family hydrolase n=1 Tax=Natronoglomus mannanivorans TaxID=2979990 RepID=A0AAP3E0C1_9EURY|nr:HAD family hydrolase [Halobacteria archaeon AArc-xg1-1]
MRAIVFDLDGTLLAFDRPYDAVLADAIEEEGAQPTDETLEAYFDAFTERFRACEPDPVHTAFDDIDVDADAESLTDSLRRHEAKLCRPPANATADLERLSEDGYALGVLTNGVREWQLTKLRAAGLEEYFDAVVVSYDVGAHKPDPAPFETLEAELPAAEYAMVGDSESDLEGASAVGWEAYRYSGGGFGELPDVFGWESRGR